MRTYIHTNPEQFGIRELEGSDGIGSIIAGPSTATEREALLQHDGKTVIAVQKAQYHSKEQREPYVLIPGFAGKQSWIGDFKNCEVHEITPIPQEQRKDISRLVRENGFEGEITFWN